MLANPSRLLPVRINDPAAYPAGVAHIDDLATEGAALAFGPFPHAACALARQYRDTPLKTVHLDDWATVRVAYADGLVCQLELVYDDDTFGEGEIETLAECRRADVDRLVIATPGRMTADGKVLCKQDGLDLLRMGVKARARTGPWRQYTEGECEGLAWTSLRTAIPAEFGGGFHWLARMREPVHAQNKQHTGFPMKFSVSWVEYKCALIVIRSNHYR